MKIGEKNLYESNKNFLLYNEDVFYLNKKKLIKKN